MLLGSGGRMAEAEQFIEDSISWPDKVSERRGFVTTEASDAVAF